MASLLGYRPALDGVRGLAILAVMALHSGAPLAEGGFLGVDLFFVLSGFLITGILASERDRTGTIRLASFYVRRALRLLPALVLLVLALAAWALVIPVRTAAVELWREIAFTLLYVTNWALAFGAMSPLGMLGHAWSLSIEEQFYLVWPLLLLVLLRAGCRRRTVLAWTVAALALAAVHRFALWHDGASADRLFFGFDTRCDTLLAGCAAGLYASVPGQPSARVRLVLRAGAAVSVVFLAAVMATVTRHDAFLYGGGFTLVAIAAALVVLEVAAHPTAPLARVFAWPPLVGVGRISYGLYLWHWPIFLHLAFAKPDVLGLPVWMVGVAASFAMAGLSWFLVERPFLRWKDRWEPVADSADGGCARPSASWDSSTPPREI